MIKKLNFLILLSTIIISCTKKSDFTANSDLKLLAYSTLKTKMSSSDFAVLDWNNAKEEKLNGIPTILKIKSKIDPTKTLIFAYTDQNYFYNWIEIEVIKNVNNIISGTLTLRDLNNSVLNKFLIDKNRIVRTSFPLVHQSLDAIKTNSDDPSTELPEVIVISYLHNNPLNWWSLYWLFNMNNFWINLYSVDEFSATPEGGISGGGIVPIYDLYAETPEILLFEYEYRKLMTTEEIQIFESMSRSDQLKYLWNAKMALDKARELYPTSTKNGRGDAFRHAYFSALNAKELGLDLAKRLGDAHENHPFHTAFERDMDLHNNQIGRNLFVWFQQNGLAGQHFREGIVVKLIQMINDGQLKYL